MIYFSFAVCCFGFIYLTAFLTSLVTSNPENETLKPEDLKGMKINTGPNEIGDA